MRVAFIVGQFPALSETFILRQITGLLDRGHDVEIFAHIPGKDSITHGDIGKYGLLERTHYVNSYASSPSRIVRLAKRLGLLITNFSKNPSAVSKSLNPLKFGKAAISLRVLDQILPFLDKGPYDIVHCHFGPNGKLGLLLKDIGVFSQKLITTFHGYDISSYLRSRGNHVYEDLFKRGDLFFCVSERIREKLMRLGCEEQKITVLRCGIDTKKFHVPPAESKKDERVKILTIARLVEKKGVEYGIRAVGKVLNKYPNLEYQIVGDGPLKDELHGLIEKQKVTRNIRLIGWKRQEEVVNLLRESDVLLAPSITAKDGDEEGIPVVIMEAMAHGLPVVSTHHAGIPEIVQDGESGFLIPERDVDALTERLERLIERPELRFAMGQNGRRFVEEHYDVDKLNDRLVRIYQQLLAGELPTDNRATASLSRTPLTTNIL
jgi:colanic acid/amylovoran biosynthesis glycosyltransferase